MQSINTKMYFLCIRLYLLEILISNSYACIYATNSRVWLFPPVPVLQQTVPPGDVAVCPLSTVQYTCVADNELQWIEDVVVGYTLANKINDTAAMAGLFWTVLTDISGNTLISTATIDSVSLQGDGGINITCREIFNSVISEQTRTVQVEGNCLKCVLRRCY